MSWSHPKLAVMKSLVSAEGHEVGRALCLPRQSEPHTWAQEAKVTCGSGQNRNKLVPTSHRPYSRWTFCRQE